MDGGSADSPGRVASFRGDASRRPRHFLYRHARRPRRSARAPLRRRRACARGSPRRSGASQSSAITVHCIEVSRLLQQHARAAHCAKLTRRAACVGVRKLITVVQPRARALREKPARTRAHSSLAAVRGRRRVACLLRLRAQAQRPSSLRNEVRSSVSAFQTESRGPVHEKDPGHRVRGHGR